MRATFQTRDLQALSLTEGVELRTWLGRLGLSDHELIQTVIVDTGLGPDDATITRVRYMDPEGTQTNDPRRPHRIAVMMEVICTPDDVAVRPLPSVVTRRLTATQAD